MAASLTPHLDATQASLAKAPLPKDDFERGVIGTAAQGLTEIAKIMDAGFGTGVAMDFAVSVAATLLDSVAKSAASGVHAPDLANALLLEMLSDIHECLFKGTSKVTSITTPVDQTPEGRA